MPPRNKTTAKVVYVARNPKDVATSTYFHNQSKGGYEGTWDEHFQLFLTSDVGCGPYFDHVLPWWEASPALAADTLDRGVGSEWASLDPQVNFDSAAGWIMADAYEGLTDQL